MPFRSLDETRAEIVAAGIAGPHQSHSRHNNISNLRACVAGDPDKSFGLSGLTLFSEQEALDALAELTGCSNDLEDLSGADTIDPVKTVDGIVAAAERLRFEAEKGATMLACTGHPTGVLEMYGRICEAYRDAGGKLVHLREDEKLDGVRKGYAEVRYVNHVGVLADWGQLLHTHAPDAMERLLERDPSPDLVLGDHGWAGAALERDIPAVAIMDINDPALAVAWSQARDVTIVPLDDNRLPRLYEPVWSLFEHIIGGGTF